MAKAKRTTGKKKYTTMERVEMAQTGRKPASRLKKKKKTAARKR